MDAITKIHAKLVLLERTTALVVALWVGLGAAPSIAQVSQGQQFVSRSNSSRGSMDPDVDQVNSALFGDSWEPQTTENPMASSLRMEDEEFEKNLAGLGDPDSDVRNKSKDEFLKRSWRLDGTIIELLGHSDAKTRMSAIEMSKELDLRAMSCMQALSKVMRHDPDWTVRRSAALALAHLGRLETHPRQTYYAYRQYRTLGRADEDNPLRYPLIVETVDDMLATLGDDEEMVRKEAVKALGFGARDPPEVEEDSYYFDPDRVDMDRDLLSQMRREHVVPALIETLEDSDESVREEAARALGRLGPDSEPAVPVILKNLNDEDWQVREGTVIALGWLGLDVEGVYEGLANALDDEEIGVQVAAARALAIFGPRDTEVVGKILAMAEHPEPKMRVASAIALGSIPDDARIGTLSQQTVDKLSDLLEDPEADVREMAAKGLSWYGTTASPYIEQIHKHARLDESARVRASAAEAIGKVSDNPERSMEVLRRMLRDRDEKVLERAVWSIGEFGEYAAPTFKLLSKLLGRSRDQALTETTMETFSKIGPVIIPYIVEELVKQLEMQSDAFSSMSYSYNPSIMGFSTGTAVRVIADMGEPAVQPAIELLEHDREAIRMTGARILGEIGPDAEAAYRPLAKMFRGRSIYEKGIAARALVSLGDISIPTFVDGATSKNLEVRLVSLGALTLLNVDGATLSPLICENVDHPDVRIRTQAILTATAVGTLAEDAIPCVATRLYDNEQFVRLMAPDALVLIGPNSPEVRKALLKRMKKRDKTASVHVQCVYSLEGMGASATPALPELAEVVKTSTDDDLVVAAMQVISRMGWDAREYFDMFFLKVSVVGSNRINRGALDAIANLSESMFSNMDQMGPVDRKKFIVEMGLITAEIQSLKGRRSRLGDVIRRIEIVNSAIKQREADRRANMSFFARITEPMGNSEFLSKYGKWIAIGLVLLIGGTAGANSYYRKQKSE